MDEEMNPVLVAETLEGVVESLKTQRDQMKDSTLTTQDACQSVIDEVIKHENADIFLNGGAAAGYGGGGDAGDVAGASSADADARFERAPAPSESGGGGCCVIA